MIQSYSTNLTVDANTAIPFNNVAIKKGCSAEMAGAAAIELNKAGIYMVSVDGSITPAAAGEVSIQLSKNGTSIKSSSATRPPRSIMILSRI